MKDYIVVARDNSIFSLDSFQNDSAILVKETYSSLGAALVSADDPSYLAKYGLVTEDFDIFLEDTTKTNQWDMTTNTSFNKTDYWNLDYISAPEAHNKGFTGKGAKVAIVDSGIDSTHPDLADHIGDVYNVLGDNKDVTDTLGHGTGTASVVASVAPDAELYIIKVFGKGLNQTKFSNTLKGIDKAFEMNVDVINCSFGRYGRANSVEEEIYKRVYDAGITVVCSSGNWGTDRYEHYPSKYEWNLGVGSINENMIRSDFSCFGEKVGLDLVAPGEDVTLAKIGGGYRTGSGTSFAAPHVAGVAALLYGANHNANPDYVREVLISSTNTHLPQYNVHEYGAGLVNALSAVNSVQAGIAYYTELLGLDTFLPF